MNERFLHQVWAQRIFRLEPLQTVAGEPLTILQPGHYNRDAGPDFFNARLKIGDAEWAGNVEIHLRSSDWNRHGHTVDPLYGNCILHAVAVNDEPVHDCHGRSLPTFVFPEAELQQWWRQFEGLIQDPSPIACSPQLPAIPAPLWSAWLDRMVMERLEERVARVEQHLQGLRGDWEDAMFRAVARSMGFSINADPMERVAASLPLRQLLKVRHRLEALEALLFGQAGWLQGPAPDAYSALLQEEYRFQRHKLGIEPIPLPGWRFLRLRPRNFPTIRIAQLASLLQGLFPMLQSCLEEDDLDRLAGRFRVNVSGYWHDHYRFGVPARKEPKWLGEDAVRLLLVNTVIPFVFARSRAEGNDHWRDKAIRWLGQLPPERSLPLREWRETGIRPLHAGDGQALLHLLRNYCTPKKCLSCSIGNHLIHSAK
jgi:hypothetical protein